MVLTLVKIVFMQMSKDNFKSKWRSKWFWESGILLTNILGLIFLVDFLLKMTSVVYNLGVLTHFHPKGIFGIGGISTFWDQKLEKKNCHSS